MEITYDIEALKTMLYDFSELTGITLSVYDYNGNNLANCMHASLFCQDVHSAFGIKKCRKCYYDLVDRCRISHQYEEKQCFMGLYEACMPILVDGIWVGYISLAGIRTENSTSTAVADKKMLESFYSQPYYTPDQIQALRNMLPKIIFNSAITCKHDVRMKEITDYIKNNLTQKLTVEHLCKKFFLTKNSLYDLLQRNLNMTVNEYIAQERLEKAKQLMKQGIRGEKITEAIGFESYSYFCQLFKAKTGQTPTEYYRSNGLSLR